MQKLSLYVTFLMLLGAAAGSYAAALDERSQTLVPQSVGQTTFDDLHQEAKAYIIEQSFPDLAQWLAFKVADQHRDEISMHEIVKDGLIRAMDMNRDGKLLLAHSKGYEMPGELIMLDVARKKLIRKIPLDHDAYHVMIMSDGNQAFVGFGCHNFQSMLLDLNTGEVLKWINAPAVVMESSQNGSLIAIAGVDDGSRLEVFAGSLSKEGKEKTTKYLDDHCFPNLLTISPLARKIAIVGLIIEPIRIIDPITMEKKFLANVVGDAASDHVYGIKFLDEKTLAVLVGDRDYKKSKICLLNIETNHLMKTIRHEYYIWTYKYGDKSIFWGTNFAYQHMPNALTVESLISGQQVNVHFPDYSKDGKGEQDKVLLALLRYNWLVASMESGRLYIWNLHSKELFEALGKLTWKQVHLLRWIYEYAIQGKKLLLRGESAASIDAIYEFKGMPDLIQRLVDDHVRFQ